MIIDPITPTAKPTPVRLEEAFMQLHLDSEVALAVRQRLLPEPLDGSERSMADIDASLVMDRFIPTLFFMKLSALLDSALNALWNEFCPDEPAEKTPVNKKLEKLGDRRLLDAKDIGELRGIRNHLAHAVNSEVGWEDFYRYRFVVVCLLTRLSNPSLRNPKTGLPDLV